MRFTIILISLLFSLNALAKSKVALLVSLNNPSQRPLFQGKDWKFSYSLINYFKKKFEDIPFELVVFNDAHQETLNRELMNPENIALFWISHAGNFNGESSLIETPDVILDVEGKNVTDIFQLIHPNLRYLAILGCKSQKIFNNLKAKGHLKENKDLIIYAKEKNIFPRREIRRSIQDLKKRLPLFERPNNCPAFSGYPIEITRTIQDSYTSVKVLHRGKLLGLFPKGQKGEAQKITVYLQHEVKGPQDLKIIFDSGIISKEKKINLGSFAVASEAFDGNWTPFKDNSGEILGITQNVYRFTGVSIPTQSPQFFDLFPFLDCSS